MGTGDKMEKSMKICHSSADEENTTYFLNTKNKNLQICDLRPKNKVFEGFLDVEGKSKVFLNPKNRKFLDIVNFHGHICPGIAIGYQAGKIAIEKLHILDEELITIVENDSCSLDAIQVITGCTLGKGNLIVKDHGKHVYTFVNRDTENALRLSLNKNIDLMYPEFDILRDKVFSGSSSVEDKMEFENHKNKISQKILEMPDNELFKINPTEIKIPDKIQMFQSVTCDICGELVAVHRARLKKGNVMCIPCFDKYLKT